MRRGLPPLLTLVAALAAGTLAAQPPVPGVLFTPAYGGRLAAADVVTLPPEDRPYVRFVSLYWCPATAEGDLPGVEDYQRLVAFALHSFNPTQLVPPVLVGAERRVARIDLRAYGISPAAFDRLVATGSGFAPFPEGYHQLTLVVDQAETPAVVGDTAAYHDAERRPLYWEGDVLARAPDGRPYMVGTRYLYRRSADYPTPKPRAAAKVQLLTRLGGQVDPADAAVLTTATHSNFPIVRADWFLYFALLEPRYHELLGVGDKLEDFDKLAFLDAKTADLVGSQRRGGVLFSEVADHNRALERTPLLLNDGRAYRWDSHDYNSSLQLQVVAGKVVNEDVLSNLLDDAPDAYEVIQANRVGLQQYLVANKQRVRIDKAVADVALDRRTPLRNKQVEIRNCFTCHAQGIIPIDDEVRATARGPIQLALAELKRKDPRKTQRIIDRYFARDLAGLVTGDQLSYDAAVKSVNGLGAAPNALLLQKAFLAFERPVTLADVCRDVGYPPDVVRGVLERAGPLDHTLAGLLAGRPQRRDQLESSGYPQLFRLLAGTPAKEK